MEKAYHLHINQQRVTRKVFSCKSSKHVRTTLTSAFEIVVLCLIVFFFHLPIFADSCWTKLQIGCFQLFSVLVTSEQLSLWLNNSFAYFRRMHSKAKVWGGKRLLFARLTDSVIWTCGIGLVSAIDTVNTKRSIATQKWFCCSSLLASFLFSFLQWITN